MLLNNKKDGGHSYIPIMPRKFLNELVYLIQVSFKNIGTQVHNLNKYA